MCVRAPTFLLELQFTNKYDIRLHIVKKYSRKIQKYCVYYIRRCNYFHRNKDLIYLIIYIGSIHFFQYIFFCITEFVLYKRKHVSH